MSTEKPLLQSSALDAELRRVLEAGTQHDPSRADLAGLTKKLAAALPPGTLPPTTPSGAPPAAAGSGGSAVGVKGAMAAAAIALGGAAIVGIVLTRSAPPSTTTSVAPPVVSTTPLVTASAVEPPIVEDVPITSAVASSAANAPIPPAPPAPKPQPAIPEATMLANAHEQILKGSPERALALTNEHAKAYPHGALAQEREVIAIEALVSLGRKEEASRRARQFHSAFPQSSHRDRVDRLTK